MHARRNPVPQGATPHRIVARVHRRSVHRVLRFRFAQEILVLGVGYGASQKRQVHSCLVIAGALPTTSSPNRF